jgi:hypothetical protein
VSNSTLEIKNENNIKNSNTIKSNVKNKEETFLAQDLFKF